MKIKTAAQFTRFNSGSNFLDSGGHYGRHHERGLPDLPILMDEYPSISLTHWLAEGAEILGWLQGQFGVTASRDEDLSWFEIGATTMERLGYVSAVRGNTYNNENDFDQDFVYEVWQKEDNVNDEWVYDEDAIVVLYVHTGCDVRGGYSRPVAVKFDGEYSLPLDWCLEFWCEELQDEDGNENYCCGYSSNPRFQLESDNFEFVRIDGDSMVFSRDDKEYTFHPSIPMAS